MLQRAYKLTAVLALLAFTAGAEDLVTPEEFEAMSTGKTFRFSQFGEWYGAEIYRPGRSVTWQYSDGTCVDGRWFANGPEICFDYEDNNPAQCWVFARRDGDFFARLAGEAPSAPGQLRLSGVDEGPLTCPGPDLGV